MPLPIAPLLLPEPELDPVPELPLLELVGLPPELLLPDDPELELVVVGFPLLLPEPELLPDDVVDPLLELLGFGALPELLAEPPLPLLLPLEAPVLAGLAVEAVDPLLPPNGLFHWLSPVEDGDELPHSQAAAASSTISQGGAIQPIFVIVTSSNRAGVPPRRGGY